ncbi:hypothetical protein [Ancylobacter vacuolatus]|uniref:Uncharacterized protein n=1 Tax=Ancylobacter vacuolatus TaxID=223389 RepID=A0ABU0DLT6_9HYPH|nr:hypothetical protein [Ancylobacter vacuolatus]MDQ0349403.1 hypothetical protein [Ancylobacter vacuolatus]
MELGPGFVPGFFFAQNLSAGKKMATKSQCVAIASRVLRVPHARQVFATDRLRLAGHLPSAQGAIVDLGPREVALIIIAGLLGEAASDPRHVVRFATMRDTAGTFNEALAALLTMPNQMIRLHLDAAGSAMIVTDAGTRHFGQPDDDAVSRLTIVDGDTFRRLAADINNAPRLRAGRPPRE